jgi:formate hydrogenlyase transcriptional activator
VADGRFRADLFYRLHVFPIHIPPLRERREDVPALVWHFVRQFARRVGKDIRAIPDETMARLAAYDWPGNVRELEHVVERAVILSPGPELRVPRIELTVTPGASPGPPRRPAGPTLKDAEREMIRQALEQSGGVVGGPAGAAAKLGLKRTTLLSRMKKLGLRRPSKS